MTLLPSRLRKPSPQSAKRRQCRNNSQLSEVTEWMKCLTTALSKQYEEAFSQLHDIPKVTHHHPANGVERPQPMNEVSAQLGVSLVTAAQNEATFSPSAMHHHVQARYTQSPLRGFPMRSDQSKQSNLMDGDTTAQWTADLIDTGAEVTVISKHTHNTIGSPPLSLPPRSLSNHILPVTGYFSGTIKLGTQETHQDVYVVNKLHQQLLGRPAIEALGVVVRELGPYLLSMAPQQSFLGCLAA